MTSTGNKFSQSIHYKIIWLMMLLAVVPILVMFSVNYTQVNSEIQSKQAKEMEGVARVYSNAINNWFEYRKAEMIQISQSRLVRQLLLNLQQEREAYSGDLTEFIASSQWHNISSRYGRELAAYSVNFDYVYDVFLVDTQGNVLYSLALEQDLGSNLIDGEYSETRFAEVVRKSLKQPGVFFSDIERYEPSRSLISGFFATQLVDGEGKLLGSVAMQFKMANIFHSLNEKHLARPYQSFYLVGQDQYLRTPILSTSDVLNIKLDNDIGEAVKNTPKLLNEIKIENVKGSTGAVVNAWLTPIDIGDKRWYLVIESDMKLLDDAKLQLFTNLFVILVCVLIAGYVLARYVSRLLLVPVNELNLFAKNDENDTSSVVPQKYKEFSELQSVLSDNKAQIQSLQQQINELQLDNASLLNERVEQGFAIDQHAIVTITDLAGTIEFANQKFSEISGYSKEELLGNNHRILNSGHHSREFFEQMYATLRRGETWRGHLCNRNKNGHLYWVDSTIVPIKDVNGKLKKYIAIRTDITDQKLAARAIEKQSQQLELVIQSTGVGIWDWNIVRDDATINDRWAQMLGYQKQELLPLSLSTWQKLVHQDYRNVLADWVANVTQNSSHYYESEVKIRHKNGDWLWVLDSGKIVEWDEDGKPLRMVGTQIDITERKNKEQELKQLSRVAAQTDNAILITDLDGITQWTNEAFTRVTGYSKSEIIGVKPGKLLQGEKTDAQAVAKISKAIKERRSFHETIINYHKEGFPYWIDIRCNPLFDEENKVSGFMAITSDVTEQVKTSEQLALQERLLQNMSRLGRIGAWQVDLVTNEIYWSPMTKEIHQVPPDFVPQMDTAINFYKEGYSRNRIGEVISIAMENGLPWNEELQLITAKGNEIWVAAYGEVQREGDKVVRLFGSFQDINERKLKELEQQQIAEFNRLLTEVNLAPEVLAGKAQQSVIKITQVLQSALKVSRASIWLCDEQAQQLLCLYGLNEAGEQIFDAKSISFKQNEPLVEILKARQHLAVDSVNAERSFSVFRSYFSQFDIKSILEEPFTAGDSSFGVILLEQTEHERHWSDSDVNFVGSLSTILSSVFATEQRRLTQEKLFEAKEEAERALRVKSDFLATMSHEIRTPMNGVIGMLDLLDDEVIDEESRRKVQIASNSANSLLHIINDILDFSRIDANKLELENIAFDLRTFIEDIISSLALLAQEKGLELLADINLPLGLQVQGDPARIRQILTNLLSNSIKFTYRGDVTLTVSAESTETMFNCRFVVSDTGIGIAQEKQQALFEPFTQVDASTTRKYGGSGLGLAICRRLVSAMDGEISMQSEVEKGSEFTVILPLKGQIDTNSALTSTLDVFSHVAVVLPATKLRQVTFNMFEQFATDVELFDDLAQLPSSIAQPWSLLILDAESIVTQPADKRERLSRQFSELAKQVMCLVDIVEQKKVKLVLSQLPEEIRPKLVAKPLTMTNLKEFNGATDTTLKTDTAGLDASNTKEATKEVEAENSSSKILLVEDNKVNQKVAGFMMSKLGYEFDVASNGLEALSLLQDSNSRYDLILMDCQMPEMDGYQATAEIRQGKVGVQYQEVPIVALTANAMEGDEEKCLAAGMDGYLAKPVQAQALQKTLVDYLGRNS